MSYLANTRSKYLKPKYCHDHTRTYFSCSLKLYSQIHFLCEVEVWSMTWSHMTRENMDERWGGGGSWGSTHQIITCLPQICKKLWLQMKKVTGSLHLPHKTLNCSLVLVADRLWKTLCPPAPGKPKITRARLAWPSTMLKTVAYRARSPCLKNEL